MGLVIFDIWDCETPYLYSKQEICIPQKLASAILKCFSIDSEFSKENSVYKFRAPISEKLKT